MSFDRNSDMIDITDMICRLFRLAEKSWKKTPAETAEIFRQYNILEFIAECYDSLHLSSDQCALEDIEVLLRNHGVTYVSQQNNADMLRDEEKEHCAVMLMRRMLEKYSIKHNVSFEDAFFQFTNSSVYHALFDYDTGVWSEGPDYLMELFEEASI